MSFRIWFHLALLVLGIWWCKEVFQRLPQDLQAFKENPNRVERLGLSALWAITALILVGIAYFTWYVVVNVAKVFDV